MTMRAFLSFLILFIPSEAFTCGPSKSVGISRRCERSSGLCLAAVTTNHDRRAVLERAAAAVSALSVLSTTLVVPLSGAAAAMPPEDTSSDFIQQLKARSEGKEYTSTETGQVGAKKLNASKFSQQYQRPSFVAIRRSNGTVAEMVDSIKIKQMEEAGKVVADYGWYIDKNGVERQDFAKGKVYFYADQ